MADTHPVSGRGAIDAAHSGPHARGEGDHSHADSHADSGSKAPDAGEVFGALADPTRRQVLLRLSADGPLSATDLAGELPVSRQAVVKHLGALFEAGLVRSDRRGREVLYGLVPERLRAATTWIDEVGRLWDTRLSALAAHFGASPTDRDEDDGGV